MSQIERVARAICVATGQNPDEHAKHSRKLRWTFFTPQAHAAIYEMDRWLPIESAPESEDMEVLVYRPDGIQKYDVMFRVDDDWYWPDGERPTTNPTHWQPLPEPPK